MHARPAAFEGVDGRAYSVEVLADETGDAAAPWGAYLFFLRWGAGDPEADAHLESEFLVRGASEAGVRHALGAMTLEVAKATLDGLIRARLAATDASLGAHGGASPPAVVLSGTGGVWRVRLADGRVVDASLRGRLKQEPSGDDDDERPLKLAVGDHVDVAVTTDANGDAWTIETIRPRRSRLARRAPGGARGERVLVANLDQVIVVFAAAEPEPHPRMLDRFLVIAEANDLRAQIVVNKSDLAGRAYAEQLFAAHHAAGYPVHIVSAKTGDGLDALREAISGRTSAIAGPSGVGKSSLMNAIFPGLALRVAEISRSVNKGRHTTVGAWLHPLPSGGFVADTPGLREVGLWGIEPADVPHCFPEFRPHLTECRFADCTHRQEPGCAVRAAVDEGLVASLRYESYLKLRAELEEGAREY